MPVLLVSRAVSGPDCAAVMTGVGGVAGAPPGTASAAAMAAEAAQAASRRRRTRDPDRLAIAAMTYRPLVNCVGPSGLQTHAPVRNSRGWPKSLSAPLRTLHPGARDTVETSRRTLARPRRRFPGARRSPPPTPRRGSGDRVDDARGHSLRGPSFTRTGLEGDLRLDRRRLSADALGEVRRTPADLRKAFREGLADPIVSPRRGVGPGPPRRSLGAPRGPPPGVLRGSRGRSG